MCHKHCLVWTTLFMCVCSIVSVVIFIWICYIHIFICIFLYYGLISLFMKMTNKAGGNRCYARDIIDANGSAVFYYFFYFICQFILLLTLAYLFPFYFQILAFYRNYNFVDIFVLLNWRWCLQEMTIQFIRMQGFFCLVVVANNLLETA